MEHIEKHFTASEVMKDIVIGMADGLTVPFALAAGLSGAVSDNSLIITAGIAEVVAGSIAMGLGGYMAGRTDVEHFEAEYKREEYEVDHLPDKEKEEVKEVFAAYGISPHLQDEIAEELSKDKKNWIDFMMKFELGMEKPNPNRATHSAITIGSAYVLGGIVPLVGYFVTDIPSQGLMISSCITILFLFVFGYVKTKLTGQSPFLGALKTVMIGILAASAAYTIAKLIS